jgi:SAM-dependent methyltransferase
MRDYWNNIWLNKKSKDMPWTMERPDHNLVTWLLSQSIKPKNSLEIGCGSSDNSIWLAKQGIDVTAVDISPIAIEDAQHRAAAAGVKINFQIIDILKDELPKGPFDLIFDRGCFHQFNYDNDRLIMPYSISKVLDYNGTWLSIIGSIEDQRPGISSPPRRSALDIILAVEPYLKITSLTASTEEMKTEEGITYCPAWLLQARTRSVPAMPWIPKSSSIK